MICDKILVKRPIYTDPINSSALSRTLLLTERETNDDKKSKSPKAVQRRKSDVSSGSKSSTNILSSISTFFTVQMHLHTTPRTVITHTKFIKTLEIG